MRGWFFIFAFVSSFVFMVSTTQAAEQWVDYKGGDGPGSGKEIVLLSGDEEYRSEESMPQLGKILAKHHGFNCTVLFAINKEDGTIDPEQVNNIPGLEALDTADLMIIFLRFRELPDAQMKYIDEYVHSGKPIIGLRTATHAFHYKNNPDSPYAHYTWRGSPWEGGFGRQVLGETWVNHYGKHQVESTRGVPVKWRENHPILRGVDEVWGPSDVYGLTTLHGDAKPLLLGQVLKGMNPNDEVNYEKPALPVAWTKTFTGKNGAVSNVFTTTMGHGGDFKDEDFRRMMVNSVYWSLGMSAHITDDLKVSIVGEYDPAPIGFGGHKTGLKPEDHAMK